MDWVRQADGSWILTWSLPAPVWPCNRREEDTCTGQSSPPNLQGTASQEKSTGDDQQQFREERHVRRQGKRDILKMLELNGIQPAPPCKRQRTDSSKFTPLSSGWDTVSLLLEGNESITGSTTRERKRMVKEILLKSESIDAQAFLPGVHTWSLTTPVMPQALMGSATTWHGGHQEDQSHPVMNKDTLSVPSTSIGPEIGKIEWVEVKQEEMGEDEEIKQEYFLPSENIWPSVSQGRIDGLSQLTPSTLLSPKYELVDVKQEEMQDHLEVKQECILP